MKVVTPEGYTFVTKFQEYNSHKVLRSVDFFSIKFDEIFFDTVCWASTNSAAIAGLHRDFYSTMFSTVHRTVHIIEYMYSTAH